MVHLAVCYSLDTSGFLSVFRFYHLLGDATAELWCDNGMNLKSGSNEHQKSVTAIEWKNVWDQLGPKGVVWKHIPPIFPMQGSSWEELAGMTKTLIAAILAKGYFRKITGDELRSRVYYELATFDRVIG